MIKKIIIILLISSSICYSKEITKVDFLGETLKIKTKPDFDGWSIGHFAGGYLISQVLTPFVKNSQMRFYIVTGLGFFYELIADGLGYNIPLTGGNDVAADFIGDQTFTALGAGFQIILNKIFKNEIRIYTDKQSVQVDCSIPIN